jgi:hypothetical protein
MTMGYDDDPPADIELAQEDGPLDERSDWERHHEELQDKVAAEYVERVQERLRGEDDEVRPFKGFGHNFAHATMIEDFVWDNTTSFLYGDAGSGKSWIALALGLCAAYGLPFLGRKTEQRKVLYVDTESMGWEDLSFRVEAVGRGLGQKQRPDYMRYWRVPLGASLMSPLIQEALVRRVETHEIGFTVIDSFTIGSVGAGTKESDEVVKALNGLAALGTLLIVDHTAKAPKGPLRPIGPTMKYAMGRSQIALSREAKYIKLEQSKPTFGARPAAPIYLELVFSELERDPRPPLVTLREVPTGWAGRPDESTKGEILQLLGNGYMATGEIVGRLSPTRTPKAVQVALSKLHKLGLVTRTDGGYWVRAKG